MPRGNRYPDAEDLGLENSDLEGSSIDRRTAVKLLGAAGISAGIAGCTGGGGGDEDTETPGDGGGGMTDTETPGDGGGGMTDTATPGQSGSDKYGGRAKGLWSADELSALDTHYMNDGDEFHVQSNVHNAITKITEDGQITGDLAKEWSIPDETTYVFPLVSQDVDVTWHNGDKFTAEDVVWSIERLAQLDDSPHQSKLSSMDSVEATGKHEVTFHMSAPTAPFLAFLTRGPGRAGVIVHRSSTMGGRSEGSQEWKDYDFKPIGTGPFQITKRRRGESVTLDRFDSYHETDDEGNALPYLDGFDISLLPEPSTQWASIQSGDGHVINNAVGEIWRQAQDSDIARTETALPGHWESIDMPSVNPHEFPERASYAGGYPESEVTDKWKDKDLVTTDHRVRKAIVLALDRQELADRAWFGAAIPAHQWYNPIMGWIYEESPPKDAPRAEYYDPERAKELLDEAGYTPDDDGVRMEVTFLGENLDQRAMTVMQSQLADIGIEAELVIKSPAAVDVERYQYIHPLFRYGGASDIDPFMTDWKQRGSPDPNRDYVEKWGMGTWSKTLHSNRAQDMKLIEAFQTPKFEERRPLLREAMDLHHTMERVDEMHEEDQLGPATATTVFPLGIKVVHNSLKDVSMPASMVDMHRAWLDN